MSEMSQDRKQLPDEKEAEVSALQARKNRAARRREKIVAEIERNRRGEYTVPTWVLTALLVVLIVGISALIIFGSR